MAGELSTLWFSQAALSAWQNCPLKFKYRYIDGLYWPISTAGVVEEHIEVGRKFHLLAQRYFNTGSIQLPPGEDHVLNQWLTRLGEYLPLTESCHFMPEYELRAARDGLRLLAKYDLLVAGEEGITIYDWKTEERAPRQAASSSPQSRLYLYLLSLTDYFVNQPDAMKMVYWNPRFPQQPLTISYSRELQEKDGLWVRKQIKQIMETDAFPATSHERNCRFCEYRPVCHGQGLEEAGADELDWEDVDWEGIQEIALQGVNMS